MNLPFSHSQFLDVFAAYNQTLWPAAALLWGATAFLVVFWLRRGAAANRAIAWLLVVHWAWSGAVYHLLFFRSINPAAAGFALLFLLQAGLFGWYAWRGGQLRFERSASAMHRVGLVLVGYSLLYPLLGLAFGLAYPRFPTFGVPCPTTLLTAGFLLLAPASLPRKLFIVPALWALVGGSAAVLLHVSADFALLAAGAALLVRILLPRAGATVSVRAALLLLTLVPLWPGAARAATQEAPADPAVLEAFLDGMIQTQLREHQIAGATVAVVGGGEILLTKGYGWADVEARRPVDPDETLFRIASVTKLFTYTAVMQLVEEGRLDLEADVNEYLDLRIPDTYLEPITLTHLMTHTAGFEEDLRNLFTFDPERIGPLEDWVKGNLPHRVRPPGTFSVYSNYGTALAGYIVERVSGLPWEDYIEGRILEPLGMDRTTGREPLPTGLAPALSQGYVPREGGFEAQPLELSPGGAPAGSMSSAAADMATFMLAFLGGGAVGDARILEEGTVARMLDRHFGHDPRLPGNGLGFFEMSSHGVRILGHGGNTSWFHNTLALFPEHDLGIFVSFNTTTAAPLTYGPFLTTFLDGFFPDPPSAVGADPVELAPLAGYYRFNRMSYTTFQKAMGLVMTMRVRVHEGALVVGTPLGTMRLVQVEPLLFREELGHTTVAFRTDQAGRPTHAFVSLVPMMGAERVPWHGAPPLHFAILGGGLLVLLGILVTAPVGWFRRWRRGVEEDRAVVVARRALLVAALAHVGFVVVVIGMAVPDFFGFLSTPMTGFAVALSLPVLGTLAAVVAGAATVTQWRRGTGTTWARLLSSGGVVVALLLAWSLHYWNLLGWRL